MPNDLFSTQKARMLSTQSYVAKRPGLNDETRQWHGDVEACYFHLHDGLRHFYGSPAVDNLAKVGVQAACLLRAVAGLLINLGVDGEAALTALEAEDPEWNLLTILKGQK